jgi:hypothetical protein
MNTVREMQKAVIIALGLMAVLFLGAVEGKAQHGTAGNGYFPPGYEGDTWTGIVTAADDKTRTVTLTYSSKKKTETFTGVLQEGCCKVKMSDFTEQELRPSQLSLTHPRRTITVYYIPKTTKAEDKKITVNEIFKVIIVK